MVDAPPGSHHQVLLVQVGLVKVVVKVLVVVVHVDVLPGSHYQVLLVVVLVQILVQVLLVVVVDELPGSHHQVVLAERDPALGTTRAEQSDTPSHHDTTYHVNVWERRIAMSLSVCASVCPIERFRNIHPNLTKFVTRVACSRDSVLFWPRCDMPCTSGFVHDVTFAYNRPGNGDVSRTYISYVNH